MSDRFQIISSGRMDEAKRRALVERMFGEAWEHRDEDVEFKMVDTAGPDGEPLVVSFTVMSTAQEAQLEADAKEEARLLAEREEREKRNAAEREAVEDEDDDEEGQ